MGSEDKKYWISMNGRLWGIILVLCFVVFFPAFIALFIIWAAGRVKLT